MSCEENESKRNFKCINQKIFFLNIQNIINLKCTVIKEYEILFYFINILNGFIIIYINKVHVLN